MSSPTLVTLFVALSLSLFLHSPSSTEAADPYAPTPLIKSTAFGPSKSKLVEHVCSRTTLHEFCMKALESDPRTASAPNLLALAKIALGLAKKNATSVCNYIDGMLRRKDTKPNLRAALEKCVPWYEAVRGSFASSLGELEDPVAANYDALVAGDYINSCKMELSSRGVSDPSISAKNEVMFRFVVIASTVTDLLRV